MKSQMKKADQSGAIFAVILGQREWENRKLTVKRLENAEQVEVEIDNLTPYLIEQLASE